MWFSVTISVIAYIWYFFGSAEVITVPKFTVPELSVPKFTVMNFSSPLDVGLAIFLMVGTIMCGSANVCNLPLLNRSGGFLTYSKFATDVKLSCIPNVPSRVGMTSMYLPAALTGAFMYVTTGADGDVLAHRSALVSILIVFHFGKRTLECLFLHKFSGTMPLTTSLNIMFIYIATSMVSIYYSSLAPPFDSTNTWLRDMGLVLFVVGLLGNWYHHYLLANLRKPGETGYKVPSGGCFEYVAAPHYSFELTGWLGLVLVSQHLMVMLVFVVMTVYLVDRAIGQSEWNRTKLGDAYPSGRRHLLPFLF